MKTTSQATHSRRLAGIGLIALFFLSLAGCATSSLDSNYAPGTDLSQVRTVFVEKLPADGRGIEKLIAEQLVEMGFQASHGPAVPAGGVFDAVITYEDKWMWDITMYMLELRVQVLKPENRFVMASGHSHRTSLVRKSPPDMVREVLQQIFKSSTKGD